MPIYTTGELAKLCGVTVRTVQYYDARNILAPSQLSEGGRRLYSEEDLQKLKIICFLRDLGLPINAISQLLADEHPEQVIDLLLDQQQELLLTEVKERQDRLEKLMTLKRKLKTVENFSLGSIGDIAYVMENKKKLRKIHILMVCVGIPLDIFEWCAFFYALHTGNWWPLVISLALTLLGTAGLILYYYRKVGYLCPRCHRIFRPGFWEMFFARHTPTTRRLTCTHCAHKGFSVEVYLEDR